MKWRVPFSLGVILIGILSIYASAFPLQEEKGVFHLVEKGQTLWRIARTYGVSLEVIKEANQIEDETKIIVGQKIFIPGVTAVLKVEVYRPDISEPNFVWPLRGRVIREFGLYKGVPCPGIDIGAPPGSKIVAALSGRVIFSNFLKGYGTMIIIDHLNSYVTCYAGQLISLVKNEDLVSQGQVIACLDDNLHEDESYLNFQIRVNAKPHNPRSFLPPLIGVQK